MDPKDGMNTLHPQAVVELAANELTGQGAIYCPNPRMPLWNTHPKVFLDVGSTGQAKCPYCSTVYRLKAGEVLLHGH